MARHFSNSKARFSAGARVGLAVLLFWALAVPILYMSRSLAVQADEAKNDPFGEPAPAATKTAHALEVVPLARENDRKIEAALDESTSIDFQETPLQGVIDFLADKHHIEIQLDDRALNDAGVDPETQLTRSLKNQSLRSALRLLLGQYELTYVVKDEVLLITTTEKASTELVARVYPVGDLVSDDSYSELTDALTAMVKPLTWEKGGGEGRWVAIKSLKSLVVSQTQEAHDEILQLLRSLRAVRRPPAVAVSAQ